MDSAGHGHVAQPGTGSMDDLHLAGKPASPWQPGMGPQAVIQTGWQSGGARYPHKHAQSVTCPSV